MKIRRKLLGAILSMLVILCCFTACNSDKEDETTDPNTTIVTEVTDENEKPYKETTTKKDTSKEETKKPTDKVETTKKDEKEEENITEKETTTKKPETTTQKETTTEITTERQPVYTDRNETVYATDIVNIRTGPDTSYSSIGTLDVNEAAKRIAIGDNGWSKISYNGGTYYVFSEYLTTQKPMATTTTAPTTTKPTTTAPTTIRPVTEESTTKKPTTTESTTEKSDSSVTKTSGGIKVYPVTSETAKQIANNWTTCLINEHYEGKSADGKIIVVYAHTSNGWVGLDKDGTRYDAFGKAKYCQYCGLQLGEKDGMCRGNCAVVFH